MRKQILFMALTFLAMPFIKVLPQDETNNTGSIAQTYSNSALEYWTQEKELSKQQEEKILKTFSAEMKAKLEEIKKLDKNKYYQILKVRFPYGTGNLSLSGETVEVYGMLYSGEKEKKEKELEIDVELLALKLKSADNSTQQKIKNDLSGKLAELFDIKEAQKQNEVERLQKRLQDLQQSLQYRKQNKNEIVQRRIQELLGDAKYLKWE